MTDKEYVSTKTTVFRYPGAGDTVPPGGAKVLLLTIGGVCVVGSWSDYGGYLGWHPLPGRDREKEARLGRG